MNTITISANFPNITDAQNALSEINQQIKGVSYYWTNGYNGNVGIRNRVWGTMGTIYGGQIGGFIGSNMDMLIYGFNNMVVVPLALSLGVFQPYSNQY